MGDVASLRVNTSCLPDRFPKHLASARGFGSFRNPMLTRDSRSAKAPAAATPVRYLTGPPAATASRYG
jgi:hypothetical protein